MLMFTDVLFMFMATFTSAAQGIKMLMCARFFTGIATGFVTCVGPMYLAEIVPKEERGKWGSLNEVMIAIGIFCSMVLGAPQDLPDLNDYTMTVMNKFDAN